MSRSSGLRLVYFPMYSNSNLNGCSTYNYANDMLKAWIEHDPNLFVYWILPEGWTVDTSREFTHPRVKKLYFYYEKKQYHQISLAPKEWFDFFGETSGKYFWDALLTECVGAVPVLRADLYGYNEFMVCKSPIFVFHGFLMSKKIHGGFIPDWLEFSQAAGMYGAYNLFSTEDLRNEGFNLCRRYMQSSAVKRIQDRSAVISTGIDTKFIDSIVGDPIVKNEKMTLNFSGRTTDGYKFPDVVEVYDYVFKGGAQVDIVMTSPTTSGFKTNEDKKKYKYMEMHTSTGREEYLKLMSKCHLFIFAIGTTHELPITVLEQLYCGVIGIFKRGEGLNEVLPSWYPEELFYDSFEEAYAVVRHVQKNYDKYKPLIEKMREFVRMYDSSKVATRTLDHIEKVYDSTFGEHQYEKREIFVPSEEAVKLVDACIEQLPSEFTFDQFNEVAKSLSRLKSGVEKESRTGRTRNYFYRLLKMRCDDKCDGEMPLFLKRAGK